MEDDVAPAPIPPNGVISSGGIYTGIRNATGPEEVAIIITTASPVVLDHCTIRGKDDLISVTAAGADVTVRNCTGIAENPNVAGQLKGRFFNANRDLPLYAGPSRVVIENNRIEGTRGIWVTNWTPSAGGEITIRRNEVVNIDGRKSNPSNTSGPLPAYDASKALGTGYINEANFVRLVDVHGVETVEIEWNRVTNLHNQSRMEDAISLFDSGGDTQSPFEIHHNLIDGAFPTSVCRPSATDQTCNTYSGGGILFDGAAGKGSSEISRYADIHHNRVLDSLNYGVQIRFGRHGRMYANRMVRDGKLHDGTVYANTSTIGGDTATGAPGVLSNPSGQPCLTLPGGYYGANEMIGNRAAWLDPRVGGALRDFHVPAADECGNVASDNGPLEGTPKATVVAQLTALEDKERAEFAAEARAAGLEIGPSSR